MKLKSLVTLSLLFVFSFSIVHEFAFAYFDNDHCSTTEYVAELDSPQNHGDICDIHFEYHQAYLLPENIIAQNQHTNTSKVQINKESYSFKVNSYFLKPPIV